MVVLTVRRWCLGAAGAGVQRRSGRGGGRQSLGQRGQALVETALSLTVLLLVMAAVLEFGRVFAAYMTILSASREGARLGIVGATDQEVTDAVLDRAAVLDESRVQVSISPVQGSRVRGEPLTVSVTYSVDIIFPVMSQVLPNPLPLVASTTMRIE